MNTPSSHGSPIEVLPGERAHEKTSDTSNIDRSTGPSFPARVTDQYDRIDNVDLMRLCFEGYRYLVEEAEEDLDRRLMLIRPKAHQNLLRERRRI